MSLSSSSSASDADSFVSLSELPDDAGEQDESYPPGFPLTPDVYEQDAEIEVQATETLPPIVSLFPSIEDREKFRELDTLFPYDFLDRSGVWPAPENVVEQPLAGQLRQETLQKLTMTDHHVEFIPPWTDPMWSARFVYTGRGPRKDEDPPDVPNPNDDPMYEAYSRAGIFQTLRPALREEDAIRNPSDTAKRYGIDPNFSSVPYYNRSAATPMQAEFSAPLPNPRETPSNQGLKAVVDGADYDALYARYQNGMSSRGGYATEDDFRMVLESVTHGNVNQNLGASCDTQIAKALLEYLDKKDQFDLREDYQRLLFGGSSTNELVEGGVWTMDKTANSELNTPIHDLFTRDRWGVTTDRGRMRPDGQAPETTRKAYNFPNQKGEYCAANDFLWMAIQPAIQLASTVLQSNHPATWAFADIYKMRPCQDSRRAGPKEQKIRNRHVDAGVIRKDYFSVHLDEDENEFTPEQRKLKDMGFNSVFWACEILRHCLCWEFMAKYEESGPDGGHSMGVTMMETKRSDPPSRPFRITICVAVDYLWPLLIDEYSSAEKAVCTWSLASTMLHELTHALNYARDQLMNPKATWLRMNPSGDWRRSIGRECLRNLKRFGYRQVWNEDRFDASSRFLLAGDGDHQFFSDEHQSEEGWAVENQYWGGTPVIMNRGSVLRETRFIDEVLTMCILESWPGDGKSRVHKMIPFHLISRLFTQHFWHYELEKWGHEAMKIWPLSSPRANCNWKFFNWSQVQMSFGWAARAWLQDVDRRVRFDYEHAVLWAWLTQLTRIAVEPRVCRLQWHHQQTLWEHTDKSLWALRNDCSEKADIVVKYMQQLYNEAYSAQPLPAPAPPIEHHLFRNAFAALSSMQRALSNEATFCQLACADYHTQLNPSTRRDIYDSYAARLRTRLDGIHLRIITDCIAFLDMFTRVDPIVLLRIAQSDAAVELLDHGRLQLRERFVAVQDAFRPVRQTFDENPEAYKFQIQDFANVHRRNALDGAKRLEKMAKKQIQGLSGRLLKVVQGWVHILERGESLRNAEDGSPDGETNRRLAATSDFIREVRRLHEEQVAQRRAPHPSEAMTARLSDPALANIIEQNQYVPDPTMLQQRFNTVAPQQGQLNPWQALYAEASGFVPYRDPTTGFTQFHRADIPNEAGPSVNPAAAAQAQAQGQSLLGALAPGGNMQAPGGQPQGQGPREAGFYDLLGGQAAPGGNALDAMSALLGERARQHGANPALAGQVVPDIYNRALQAVAGPNGQALVNTNMPGAGNLFGAPAAQNSMAQQQLEGLIRQQALGPNPQAALGNLPSHVPGVGVAPPPSQAYEPVGGSAFPANPPGTPPSQQGPFQPPGGLRPGNTPPGAPQPPRFTPQGGPPPP